MSNLSKKLLRLETEYDYSKRNERLRILSVDKLVVPIDFF